MGLSVPLLSSYKVGTMALYSIQKRRKGQSINVDRYISLWPRIGETLSSEQINSCPYFLGFFCCLVGWLEVFFSFPQSTRYCWLLPRSSWACTAAAVLLLEEVILMPESQEGRSSGWWVLPVTQHSSLLLYSLNSSNWTCIHTFSPAWTFDNKASERVAKVTSGWI